MNKERQTRKLYRHFRGYSASWKRRCLEHRIERCTKVEYIKVVRLMIKLEEVMSR
jgi:hypothetical protein